jgi:hypothetical protein
MTRTIATALALAAVLAAGCSDEPSPRIGEICSSTEDCTGELGEYCSRVFKCVRSCAESACSAGSRCARIGERAVCLRACAADSDCDHPERCSWSAAPAGPVCVLEQPLAVFGPGSYY